MGGVDEGNGMPAPNYPPLDSEALRWYVPRLVERQGQHAKLTEDEFQKLVSTGQRTWKPDLSQGGRVVAREHLMPASTGDDELSILVLSPAEGVGPFACIYYIANGAMMQRGTMVGLTSSDTAWVAELGIVLVSIAPRVGPEHPYPAQVEDSYAGLEWVVEHADELNIDASKIITMGKSGGGGIAAAVALYARDHSGPEIAAQLLIYPMLDDRCKNPSSSYDVPPWTAANNRVGWRAVLGESVGTDRVSHYAAPARATDLSGLPPTYLEVGSSEVFRDETIDYGARIARAGGSVELHSYQGGVHAFEVFGAESRMGSMSLAVRKNYLERTLDALEHRP